MVCEPTSRLLTADSERALDAWVHNQLAEAYGNIAEDRLPDDLIRLLDGQAGV